MTELFCNLVYLMLNKIRLGKRYDGENAVAAALTNEEIDKKLEEDKKARKKVIKLLLLGDDKSGKSELLTQMKLYNDPHENLANKENCSFISNNHSAITEVKFMIKDVNFKVIDISGQKSETRKWIHSFEDVNAVIYIADLCKYDQAEYEDDSTNEMIKSMKFFEEMCNSQWFRKTSFILFLNNTDLFNEKIMKTSIKIAFPDFQGVPNFEEQIKFIEQKFLALFQSDVERKIYAFQTSSDDSNQIENIYESVFDALVNASLTPP